MTTPARPFLFRPRLAGVLAELAQPSSAYFTREDGLFVTVRNSAPSVEVGVRGRFMDVTGEIKPFSFSVIPTADRLDNTSVNALGEGFLVNLFAFVASGAARRGETFMRAGLSRGIGAARVDHSILVQGYVHDLGALAWPGGRLEGVFDNPGVVRAITGTDPAAGVEILETVPTGARWRPISFRAALVTDATVASRTVMLVLDDGAAILQVAVAGVAQAASLTRRYNFQFGAGFKDAAFAFENTQIGLPATVKRAGWRLRTLTENLQPGDNWEAPQMSVEEWISD